MSESYKAAGVDYDALDAAKRAAIAAALATSGLLTARSGEALDESRGEPAFVFRLGDKTLAIVQECLGTKSVIARRYQETTGEDLFHHIGYDAVAAIVNDLCCVGALPLVVNAYFSTGSSRWYEDTGRFTSLVAGWRRACEDAGCTWGGGESPSLSGLVSEDDIELAGGAVGEVVTQEPLLGAALSADDDIVLVASTGLHANGASLVRSLASGLPDGLRTQLPGGRPLGEAVLDPSPVYVPLVARLFEQRVPVTYLSHITGHGMRKLMRADRDLSYEVDELPRVPEVLAFLVDRLGMSPEEAYGTFNMGAGFAVFCRSGAADDVVSAARAEGLEAVAAGKVRKGTRRVVLGPVGVTFSDEDLSLR